MDEHDSGPRPVAEDPDDYRRAFAAARARFADRRVHRKPLGLTGVNFMTPDVVGYYRCDDDTIVELSTGWFMDHRLWGVSWGPDEGDRSQACHSLDEVEALILAPPEG